jgi:superoxide dismutase
VLDEELGISDVRLAGRWQGGTLVLQPGDMSAKAKEIPLESFFHKIVMVRDRLRVLEAKINGNKSLTEEDKVDLQQYVTRAYGSLTSFNVLFSDKNDHFKGSGGSR